MPVLYSRSKPARDRLKLPQLLEVLSKKQLQQNILDHGVLTLSNVLIEPLPDYTIGLEKYDRRVLLKKSGHGKTSLIVHQNDHVTIILMPQGGDLSTTAFMFVEVR